MKIMIISITKTMLVFLMLQVEILDLWEIQIHPLILKIMENSPRKTIILGILKILLTYLQNMLHNKVLTMDLFALMGNISYSSHVWKNNLIQKCIFIVLLKVQCYMNIKSNNGFYMI